MRDILPCDYPQCECDYDCERNDKHEQWLKEHQPLCPNCGGTSDQPEYVFCGMCREMGCPLDKHS